MQKEIYVIKDIKSGLFTEPSVLVNEECAKRWFLDLCKSLRGGVQPSDLQLFFVGKYDDSFGCISDTTLSYVMDGE